MDIDKIYNMDCLEGMKQLEDNSVDMVLTSPPYDNLRTYGHLKGGFTFEMFKPIAKELSRILKEGGVIVWNVNDATIKGSETCTSFRQVLFFKDECGLNLHDTMIWEKTCAGALGSNKCYLQNFEYMFILSKGKLHTFNPIEDRKNVAKPNKNTTNGGLKEGKGKQRQIVTKEYGKRTNIWRINQKQRSDHPAPFPYLLARDHIVSWSNENDIVLDPFIGSGTTAIAAIKENRHFIGMELNKEYYDIACERIKKEQAEIENSLFNM